MITLGVTGGIGSGKSEIGRLLRAKGAVIVDADRLVHEAYTPGEPAYGDVVAAFGPDIVAADGSLDRAALGAVVFKDPSRLKQLTDIVWPVVGKRVQQLRDAARRDGAGVFVVEAPLLVDAGWRARFDAVWLVRTPDAAIRLRLAKRGFTDEVIEARLTARRLPDEASVDTVIENDGDLATLSRRVDEAWDALLTRLG